MARAPYATDPAKSRGRLYPEPEHHLRTPFARDRDRLIHSTGFRRLRHKTQVFVDPNSDHFRVRLTHSMEVAQIARSLARALGLDEDLTEVLALGHDLGHPPFGHSGEDALNAVMAPVGGFDHNGHAIRILTRLEFRTPARSGLNLTWETLEGMAKHNGPVTNPGWALAAYDAKHSLELWSQPSLEAQVAALSDDIAYNAHDLDDGLRAGLLNLEEVCAQVPLIADLWGQVLTRFPHERRAERLIPQLVRDLIGLTVDDLLATTRANLAEAAPGSVEEVRGAGRPLVAFSPGMIDAVAPLRTHLMQGFYTHPKLAKFRQPAAKIVQAIYRELVQSPERLPEEWQQLVHGGRGFPAGGLAVDDPRCRRIGDYVAGMTDRFAIAEHLRLLGSNPMPDEELFSSAF